MVLKRHDTPTSPRQQHTTAGCPNAHHKIILLQHLHNNKADTEGLVAHEHHKNLRCRETDRHLPKMHYKLKPCTAQAKNTLTCAPLGEVQGAARVQRTRVHQRCTCHLVAALQVQAPAAGVVLPSACAKQHALSHPLSACF